MGKTIRLTPTTLPSKRKVVVRKEQGQRREERQRLNLAVRVAQRQEPGLERDLALTELA
jgi:hypothetical protein